MPQPIMIGDLSGLAQGIQTAGGALGQALQKRGEIQRNRQEGNILNNILSEIPQNASPLAITQALSLALNQGVSPSLVKDFGSLYSVLQKSRPNQMPGADQIGTMANLFKKFGMEEEVANRNAELWANLTVGGQTEMAKLLVDQIARNQFLPSSQQVDFSSLNSAIPDEMSVNEEVEDFKFPKVNVFEDRTPKERAQLKSQLLKENNQEIKDINQKLRKTDEEIMRYDQLERLNESKKLPSGALGRLNVNWNTGDLRIPFLANPETQLFVKTINDFTVAAKDTYGSRVTNFELGAFMKRLPTLANSEEGRRAIIGQMKAMKGLDRLYEQSLKKVYDQYGVQNIDRSTAEKIAADLRKEDEDKLKKDFKNAVDSQVIYEAKYLAPEGKIPARSPDGKIVYIWQSQADKAEKRGYKPL